MPVKQQEKENTNTSRSESSLNSARPEADSIVSRNSVLPREEGLGISPSRHTYVHPRTPLTVLRAQPKMGASGTSSTFSPIARITSTQMQHTPPQEVDAPTTHPNWKLLHMSMTSAISHISKHDRTISEISRNETESDNSDVEIDIDLGDLMQLNDIADEHFSRTNRFTISQA